MTDKNEAKENGKKNTETGKVAGEETLFSESRLNRFNTVTNKKLIWNSNERKP